jgi:hypothetical protein
LNNDSWEVRRAQQVRPVWRRGGFPLDSHLVPATRLDLDPILFGRCAARRDELDESWLGCSFPPAGWNSTELFLQPRIIQPQTVGYRINTVLPSQFDRSLPEGLRQLRPPRLDAAKLLQLAL